MSQSSPEESHRTLTDEDVDAIAKALEKRITDRFRHDVGAGVIKTVWQMLLWGFVALLVWFAARGMKV